MVVFQFLAQVFIHTLKYKPLALVPRSNLKGF